MNLQPTTPHPWKTIFPSVMHTNGNSNKVENVISDDSIAEQPQAELNRTSILKILPPEIMVQIFPKLDFVTLVKTLLVSRDFFKFGSDPILFNSKLSKFIFEETYRFANSVSLISSKGNEAKIRCLYSIVLGLLKCKGNLRTAIAISEKIPASDIRRTFAFCEIAKCRAQKNPNRSYVKLFKKLQQETAVEKESSEEWRTTSYKIETLLVVANLQLDEQHVFETLREANRLAGCCQNPNMLSKIYRVQRKVDPEAAKKTYSLLNETWQTSTDKNVIIQTAKIDPLEAIAMAKGLREINDQAFSMLEVARIQAENNDHRAMSTIEQTFSHIEDQECDRNMLERRATIVQAHFKLEKAIEKALLMDEHQDKILTLLGIAKAIEKNQENAIVVLRLALETNQEFYVDFEYTKEEKKLEYKILIAMAEIKDLQGLQLFFKECNETSRRINIFNPAVAMLVEKLPDQLTADFVEDFLAILIEGDDPGDPYFYYELMAKFNLPAALTRALKLSNEKKQGEALSRIVKVLSVKDRYNAFKVARLIRDETYRALTFATHLVG